MGIPMLLQKQSRATGMRSQQWIPPRVGGRYARTAGRAYRTATMRVHTPFLDCGVYAPLDKLRGLLERWSAPGTRAATILHRRELPVRNSIAHGRRVVLRMTVLQLGCTALIAGITLFMAGERAAVAALAGGALSAIAWAASGVRALSGSPAGGGSALARLVGALLLKWLIVCGGLWIALAQWRLPPMMLVAGFGAALVAGVLGLAFEDRERE
jgi:hypothetical protein